MSEPAEKLNDLLPLSPDHNAERLAALKTLFPDLFTTEGRLNVDELKKVVDPALVGESERYDFRWYGKSKSKREAFTPSRAALVYDPARSVHPDKAGGNMIIEGENLEVLKLLSSSYRERVKVIYIDPPYNTGKDFVYSDNYSEDRKPYWEQTGVTEAGVRVDTNADSNGRFHSNWLSMIHSRLLVARYLLRPDGVIFVSIDDGEVQNLRRAMDEVFGEESFVASVIWEKADSPRNSARQFSEDHDYILVYSKNPDWSPDRLPRTEEANSIYQNPDNDPKGPWLPGDPYANHYYSKGTFTVSGPTGRTFNPPPGRYWRISEPKFWELDEQGRIWWGPNRDARPSIKRYLSEVGDLVPRTLWKKEDVGSNRTSKNEVRNLFPDVESFDTPKPTKLIDRMLRLATNEDDSDLVVDFFAGSGTTAHAVMELNKTDGGNRKFILVQLPEFAPEDSAAYKAGYRRISDITIDRNRRVIARFQKEAEGLLPIAPERAFADSLGFKVYKLAKSAFPRVEFAPDPDKTEAENIELLRQYIREKEKTLHFQYDRETVLDEVLLKNGFMLDYTLTPRPEFTENKVELAKDAYKESLVCLDESIAPATIDYFKAHPDHFFICLQLALDMTKKWNLKHHLGDKLKAI